MSDSNNTKLSNSEIVAMGYLPERAEKRRKENLRTISTLVQEHLPTLAFKYRQSFDHNDYGVTSLNIKKWNKHEHGFIFSVIAPEIGAGWANNLYDQISEIIKKQVEEAQSDLSKDISKMTPYEFEEHCANILRVVGWMASVTKKSGDQGVDIVAQKGKILAVLQCKLYTGTIGNAAVQEAIAGREFMKAHFAAVVTNSSYTKSARQLASNTGVFLLHLTELATLEKIIKG